MSATDELREGLRKRGESWHKWPDEDSTTWQAYSDPHTATESMDGTLIVTRLTPEQAIAATLGPMTCQADETDTWECVCDGIGHYGVRMTIHVMECSECGRTYEHVNGGYEHCPHCGRRIVEVDDG